MPVRNSLTDKARCCTDLRVSGRIRRRRSQEYPYCLFPHSLWIFFALLYIDPYCLLSCSNLLWIWRKLWPLSQKKKSIVYFSDDWSWKLSKNQYIQKNHSLHLQYSSIKLCVCRFISCPPKIYICIVISKSSFWMLPANMQESFWKMVTHIGNIMVKLYVCFAFFGEKTLSPTPPSTN